MGLVVGHGFVRHTFPRCYIALIHDLTLEDLRRVAVCQSDEKQQDACVYSDLLQYFLVHISIFRLPVKPAMTL